MGTIMTRSASVLALISARGGGDWPPVMALAHDLSRRDHQVRVVCDETTEAVVNAAGLPTICLPPELEQGRYFESWTQRQGNSDSPSGPIPYPLAEWAQACLPVVRAALGATPPDLLVSSLFCLPLAAVLASELGVPWCFVNPAFYFGEGSRRAWDEDFAEPSLSSIRDRFLPLAQQATLVLHATDPHLDFRPDPLPAHHRYVGPLFWERPSPVPAFLHEPGPPWVLVSLSTVPQDGDLAIARGAIQVLRHAPVRVLITVSPGHAREELDALPDNVCVSGFVSHSAALRSSRLVISHAGHGVVMKALRHGVPMVLVPWGRDQPGVAARAAAAGAAVVVTRDALTDERVAQAVREVTREPRYEAAARAIGARMRRDEPVAMASRYVEELLGLR